MRARLSKNKEHYQFVLFSFFPSSVGLYALCHCSSSDLSDIIISRPVLQNHSIPAKASRLKQTVIRFQDPDNDITSICIDDAQRGIINTIFCGLKENPDAAGWEALAIQERGIFTAMSLRENTYSPGRLCQWSIGFEPAPSPSHPSGKVLKRWRNKDMPTDGGIFKKIEDTIAVKIINGNTEPGGWEAVGILLPCLIIAALVVFIVICISSDNETLMITGVITAIILFSLAAVIAAHFLLRTRQSVSISSDRKAEMCADMNTPGNKASTPTDTAETSQAGNMTALLHSPEKAIEQRDEMGWTPLMGACISSNIELAEKHIEKGASLESQDTMGFTPLHQACRLKNLTVVKFLIAKKARLNSTDSMGCTPLHIAAGMGAFDIVELLLEAGADPEKEAYDGINAAQVAEQKGHNTLADTIRRFHRA